MPVIDFSDVRELKPIDNGDYPATLTAATYKPKTATSKGDFVSLEFTLAEDEDYPEASGRKMFLNLSLLPQSLWKYKQTMIALGADPELFEDKLDPEEVAKDRVGSDCILTITQRPDQRNPDEYQNQVNRVKSADSFS